MMALQGQKDYMLKNKNNFNFIPKYQMYKNKSLDQKYKTELCKKFLETGRCPYGSKCRFAHGQEELKTNPINTNYKKKPCKSYMETGFCPFGFRCSFRHEDKNEKAKNYIPHHFIELFIYNKLEHFEKRLPIFEEITNSKQSEENQERLEIKEKNNSFEFLENSIPIKRKSTNNSNHNLSTSTLSNEDENHSHEDLNNSPKNESKNESK